MHRTNASTLEHRAVIFVVIFLLAAAARLNAAAVPLGTEFLVNTNTAGAQLYPSIAVHDSGSFVVAWGDFSGGDGSGRGVFARRFDSLGAAIGAEFQVNSYTPGPQDLPSVAVAANGGFVIGWVGYDGQDGSGNGIFARRFDAAGVAQATAFQVNSYTNGHQLSVSLAVDGGGDFVIAWTSFQTSQDGSSDGVFARRFDAAGTPQAAEFQVNVFTQGSQEIPRVDSDTDGDFVVAWVSNGQDGSLRGVFGRRFDSTGAPVSSEFQINEYTPGEQNVGGVALDADGDFVVTWSQIVPEGVFARRFSSAGNPLAAAFQVNVDALTLQYAGPKSVSLDADGDFVVTWSGYGGDGSGSSVRSRQFHASGIPLTTELQVNTWFPGQQRGAAGSMDATGDFVVAWHGEHEDDPDTGIFARRFRSPAVLDIDGDGTIDPLTDGLLVLRDEFGFSGGVLVNGVVSAGCLRCTAPEIEAYLDTLK